MGEPVLADAVPPAWPVASSADTRIAAAVELTAPVTKQDERLHLLAGIAAFGYERHCNGALGLRDRISRAIRGRRAGSGFSAIQGPQSVATKHP